MRVVCVCSVLSVCVCVIVPSREVHKFMFFA